MVLGYSLPFSILVLINNLLLDHVGLPYVLDLAVHLVNFLAGSLLLPSDPLKILVLDLNRKKFVIFFRVGSGPWDYNVIFWGYSHFLFPFPIPSPSPTQDQSQVPFPGARQYCQVQVVQREWMVHTWLWCNVMNPSCKYMIQSFNAMRIVRNSMIRFVYKKSI